MRRALLASVAITALLLGPATASNMKMMGFGAGATSSGSPPVMMMDPQAVGLDYPNNGTTPALSGTGLTLTVRPGVYSGNVITRSQNWHTVNAPTVSLGTGTQLTISNITTAGLVGEMIVVDETVSGLGGSLTDTSYEVGPLSTSIPVAPPNLECLTMSAGKCNSGNGDPTSLPTPPGRFLEAYGPGTIQYAVFPGCAIPPAAPNTAPGHVWYVDPINGKTQDAGADGSAGNPFDDLTAVLSSGEPGYTGGRLFGRTIPAGDTIYVRAGDASHPQKLAANAAVYSTSDLTSTGTLPGFWTFVMPDPSAAPGSVVLSGVGIGLGAAGLVIGEGFGLEPSNGVLPQVIIQGGTTHDVHVMGNSLTNWVGHSGDPKIPSHYPTSSGKSEGTIISASPLMTLVYGEAPQTINATAAAHSTVLTLTSLAPGLGNYVFSPGYYTGASPSTGIPNGSKIVKLNGMDATQVTWTGKLVNGGPFTELTGGGSITGTVTAAGTGYAIAGTATTVGGLPTPTSGQPIWLVQATPTTMPAYYQWANPVAAQWNLFSGTSLPASETVNGLQFVIQTSPTDLQTVFSWSNTTHAWSLLKTFLPFTGTAPEYYSVQPSTTAVQTAEELGFTLTGTGFGLTQGSGSVKIGGVAAQITAWSNTSITLLIASGATAPTVGNSVVSPNGGGSITPSVVTTTWVSLGTYLPATTSVSHDAYQTTFNNHIWSWTGSAWSDVGQAAITIGPCDPVADAQSGCPTAAYKDSVTGVTLSGTGSDNVPGCDPLVPGITTRCSSSPIPAYQGTTRALSNEAVLWMTALQVLPNGYFNQVDWFANGGTPGISFSGGVNAAGSVDPSNPNLYTGETCIGVKDNTIRDVANGGGFGRTTNSIFFNNWFKWLAQDGLDFFSVHRVWAIMNYISDFTLLQNHQDSIQIAHNGTDPETTHYYSVSIVDNEAYDRTDPTNPFPRTSQGINNTDGIWYNEYVANNILATSTAGIGLTGFWNVAINNTVVTNSVQAVHAKKVSMNSPAPTHGMVVNNVANGIIRESNYPTALSATTCDPVNGALDTVETNQGIPFLPAAVNGPVTSIYCLIGSFAGVFNHSAGAFQGMNNATGVDWTSSPTGVSLFLSYYPNAVEVYPSPGAFGDGSTSINYCIQNMFPATGDPSLCPAGRGVANLRPNPSFVPQSFNPGLIGQGTDAGPQMMPADHAHKKWKTIPAIGAFEGP